MKTPYIKGVTGALNNVGGKIRFTYYKIIYLGLLPIEKVN
jgi:hypothetical protein